MKTHFLFRSLLVFLLAIILSGCAVFTEKELTIESNNETNIEAKSSDNQDNSLNVTEATDATLLANEQTLIELYRRVNPAVVNIQVVDQIEIVDQDDEVAPQSPDLPEIPDFPNLPNLQPFDPGPRVGQGSGFVYDKKATSSPTTILSPGLIK